MQDKDEKNHARKEVHIGDGKNILKGTLVIGHDASNFNWYHQFRRKNSFTLTL
jgi:hypothetical protein